MNKATLPARRKLLLAAAAFALASPAFAWSFNSETVRGSGNVRTETRKVDHFTGLAVSVPANVELRIGSGEGVSIETDDNVAPLIETRIKGDTLEIRPVRDGLNFNTRTLHITVNAREIDRLTLAGSGSISADTLRARNFNATLSGSGSINARAIEGDSLSVNLAGSGNLSAGGGNMNLVKISIAGSGDVDLGKLKANEVRVHTAGSGDSTVWASGTLNVSLLGSGDVSYYGDPRVSRSVLGSGDVRRIGGTPR